MKLLTKSQFYNKILIIRKIITRRKKFNIIRILKKNREIKEKKKEKP